MRLFLTLVLCPYLLYADKLPGSDIQSDVRYEWIETAPYGSKLYNIVADTVYDDPVQLIDLIAPTSFQLGYDYGYLLGEQTVTNYNAVLKYLLGDEWYEPIVAEVVNKFLDWQWDNYLSVQLTEEYLDEIRGLTQGGHRGGTAHDIGKIVSRCTVIANFPGSLENLAIIFKDEAAHPPNSIQSAQVADVIKKLSKRWSSLSCSMFGVWGARTRDGHLYTGRNLDWIPQMGISKYKLIAVFHPSDGYAHATVGWAGIWGSITGMSSEGLTVHEANLESDDITFRGFPWVLRLRYIMTYSSTIEEALSLWNSTNNTVGFNHGVGSRKDSTAVVMETMMGNTAVFADNDPREMDFVYDDQQIGAPRENTVYRTNHGYDPYTIQHFLWNGTNSYEYSIQRYLLFPELFDSYEASGVKIGAEEAVNITAIVADKDDDHVYDCGGGTDGWNILSVTFDTHDLVMYTAWENGYDGQYMCAACNTYLRIDMTQWFT